MKYKILVVDDEPSNLRLLERLLRRSYTVISASSGGEALKLLELHDVALIVSDQRMPGMTGIQFLKKAAEMRPQTVRIILTGYTDVNDLVEAINSRIVYKYVTKPWINEDLLVTVTRGVEYYETNKGRHELVHQNARLTSQILAIHQGVADVVSKAISSQDPTWPDRRYRLMESAELFTRWLDMTDADVATLMLAAQLCEIGRLSAADTEKDDIVAWAALLEKIPGLQDVAVAISFQHEHFDGTGVPQQLAGEDIPRPARILAIVRAYDRLLRSDGNRDLPQSVLESLQQGAGSQLDPVLVDAFRVVQSMQTAPAVTSHPVETWRQDGV